MSWTWRKKHFYENNLWLLEWDFMGCTTWLDKRSDSVLKRNFSLTPNLQTFQVTTIIQFYLWSQIRSQVLQTYTEGKTKDLFYDQTCIRTIQSYQQLCSVKLQAFSTTLYIVLKKSPWFFSYRSQCEWKQTNWWCWLPIVADCSMGYFLLTPTVTVMLHCK